MDTFYLKEYNGNRRYLIYCTRHVYGINIIRYTHIKNIGKPNDLKVFGGGGNTKRDEQDSQNRPRLSTYN